MHLHYVHQLLGEIARKTSGDFEIPPGQAEQEIRLMVEAGLVEATFAVGADGSATRIHRLTDSGRSFLRAFKNDPIASQCFLTEEILGELEDEQYAEPDVLGKWKANFTLGLQHLTGLHVVDREPSTAD